VPDDVLAQWFSFQPAAQPIHAASAHDGGRKVLSPAVSLAVE
jgi:hypothetical protein